jgi:hypothetical protein
MTRKTRCEKEREKEKKERKKDIEKRRKVKMSEIKRERAFVCAIKRVNVP